MSRAATEVRLAIVMNGGVSLAVWMGGVTHEIDLLRRASAVPRGATREDTVPAVPAYDRDVFWRWVELCREHAVGRVAVDVVAGTSAGGLNGTLLASAVAAGAPLDTPDGTDGPWLRGMWEREATLEEGQLVRPGDEVQPSVLDGEKFAQVVAKVVGELRDRGTPSQAEPVTLFVTATGLGASRRHYADAFGQPFDVADHRRLYRFTRHERDAVVFRPGDGEPSDGWWDSGTFDDFAGATAVAALTNAARASASFPFSFSPVRESAALAARRLLPPATVEPQGGRWLVDGGILDNAPFQPVLDAVARRPLRGPVRRLVVNVVPSAGTVGQQAQTDGDLPDWTSIGGAVVGFPRETDQRDDVERTEQLLARGEGVAAAPEALFAEAVDGSVRLDAAAEQLLLQYRRARVVGGLLDLRRDLTRTAAGLVTRLDPGRVGDADALLLQAPGWVPAGPAAFDAYDTPRWQWGLGAAERVLRLQLRDLRRRLDAGGADADRLARAVSAVGVQLSRVEAVRDDVARQVRRQPPEQFHDDALTSWLTDVFTTRRVGEALGRCVRLGADGYAAATGSVSAADAVRRALQVEVCSQAFTAYAPFDRTAPFELLRIGPDVETPLVDDSPQAVAVAREQGDHKLYGTRLKHFAAFGRRQWRRWDWACGRLDAQVHIARALAAGRDLDPVALAAARTSADSWLRQTQQLTLAQELGAGGDGADFRRRREEVWTKTDAALVAELRDDPAGNELVLRLVDATMRALPHDAALGRPGYLLNSLLARRPKRRFPPVWAVPARVVARRVWLRRIGRFGQP
ncbi:MAG: patatin-related protein [Frankiales bacterium]|jgi:patatin-related protein|nr:patatin-related protein [Frankiales bacterium]